MGGRGTGTPPPPLAPRRSSSSSRGTIAVEGPCGGSGPRARGATPPLLLLLLLQPLLLLPPALLLLALLLPALLLLLLLLVEQLGREGAAERVLHAGGRPRARPGGRLHAGRVAGAVHRACAQGGRCEASVRGVW